MIDLLALANIDRETEVTYIRRERDWLDRAVEAGRVIEAGRRLPVLPASVAARAGTEGNGHSTNGHGQVGLVTPGDAPSRHGGGSAHGHPR